MCVMSQLFITVCVARFDRFENLYPTVVMAATYTVNINSIHRCDCD